MMVLTPCFAMSSKLSLVFIHFVVTLTFGAHNENEDAKASESGKGGQTDAKERPKGCQGRPKGAQAEAKGKPREAKGRQAKGRPMDAQGKPRKAKGRPRDAKGWPR